MRLSKLFYISVYSWILICPKSLDKISFVIRFGHLACILERTLGTFENC